jgi:hypothetical protein
MRKPELGAHVQKDSDTDTNWYIIPLCVKHSIKAEFLEIVDTATFVSAHVNDTCAKPLPLGNTWLHDMRESLAASALRHGVDTAEARDWQDHIISAATQHQEKRKEKQAELWVSY